MNYWRKHNHQEIKDRVFGALAKNINYYDSNILGLPASHLDKEVFYQDLPFLKDAPFLTSLIHNPNHIGCHTLDKSEHFFSGTQAIERELISICAEDIFGAEAGGYDGYVAAGGTEANMQAIWIYRNLFKKEFGAEHKQIFILSSADSHYSMAKASNVFDVDMVSVPTESKSRQVDKSALKQILQEQKQNGKKYAIVVCNMMTTMYGSVDQPDAYINALNAAEIEFRLHVDGAYGGFFYPFSNQQSVLNFKNPAVSSITIDAHKMAQAPYGTGIFLVRKGLMHFANTKEASYVEGEDFTLIGSRSGANAIAVWMILQTHGPHGWQEKVEVLLNRAKWFCHQLDELGLEYYREPFSNIVTIESSQLSEEIVEKYGLVPDNHQSPKAHKIVIMDHVNREKLTNFLDSFRMSKAL
ncbi:pyridoxal phosphate-dependent decarboxylase family protein [Fulvivirgaceae bacterium LMO-SS25]